ncbi:MAG: N-acetyltransferase [Saprospiraceae bacterium]|nr:N-acetyltransferase [Saprospiraceae bacterium]
MEAAYSIRPILASDAAGCLEIYKNYVETGSITFDYTTPTIQEFQNKITDTIREYPWLVCLKNNQIAGYAYASKYRYKTAYQWSAESTIYLSGQIHGRGLGSLLYETLLKILSLQGFYNIYAAVTIPNTQSEMLHAKLGFYEIGIFKNNGFKLGKWHDVKWFQKTLKDYKINPKIPLNPDELMLSEAFQNLIKQANNKLPKT